MLITKENKILTLLGFAQKAGKVHSGDTAVLSALESKKAKLVLMAHDAADSTREKFIKQCADCRVKFIEISSKDGLGSAIGKAQRAAIAITDRNFAQAILKRYEDDSEVCQ
ncbi:MAG: ribosomal L7Ae/L30e/S12e/Gadd45 family protein [Negativicutes bacterium]